MSEPDTAQQAGTAPEEPPIFRIALSMSGAISAGAYTAGVFDFLMLALAELERAKRERPKGFVPPNHDVRIVAMTGASAGGVTAALGAVALGHGMGSPPAPMVTEGTNAVCCTLPSLYTAWVEKPRLVARNGRDPALLTTEDLRAGKVVSALNARVLEDIRDTAMQPPPQQSRIAAPYAFLARPLHLYLTISNLPGIPYAVRGSGPYDLYRMVNHGDRVHVRFDDLGGDTRVASDWAGVDQITAACCLAQGPQN